MTTEQFTVTGKNGILKTYFDTIVSTTAEVWYQMQTIRSAAGVQRAALMKTYTNRQMFQSLSESRP